MPSDAVEVEGPDGNTYEFPSGTDKNAAIKYFKAKGIGGRSAASPIAPPSVQRPKTDMSEVYLVGGEQKRPLSDQLGEMATGMAKSTAHVAAMVPVTVHRSLQNAGVVPQGNVFPGEHTMQQVRHEDLPNSVIMAAGGLEGMDEPREAVTPKTPRGKTVSEPPGANTPKLDPEAQAKYTADLDAANKKFEGESQKYHDTMRQRAEAHTAHEDAMRATAEKSKQAEADYREKLDNTFDKAKRTQLETAAEHEKARGEWAEKSRAYHEAQRQAEATELQRHTLERGSQDAVKQTYDNLQQAYSKGKSALGQRWNQFREQMKGAQLDASKTFNDIESAKAKYLKGSPASLQVFNNLVKEMGIQEFMEGEKGELTAIQGSGDLPFDTARVHYSAIGDRLAQGDLPGNVYHALKAVEEGLDKQLTDAAASRKLGDTYTELKANEHQFRSDWEDKGSPLMKAHKALDPNFLKSHVMGVGNEYLARQLERYRQYGADPTLPAKAKQMATQAKGLPEVKVPKDPGPEPTRSKGLAPEATSPEYPRGATVPKPPDALTKVAPEAPELEKVERPAPKGKGTKPIPRIVRRVALKLAGGHAGGFPGYIAGGELDTEIERQIRRRQEGRVPPPPE